MKKKSRQKIFYALAMVASTFLSEGAQAKIHPKAFKNITRYFKKGMEFYSPVLGEAALESGLIYDLRFYGNFESAVTEGKRVYIKDKSADPLWTLEKSLFPSPAGHLQVETQAASSFGKLASPKSVALLLNYAKDIRVGKLITSKDETKLREALLASFVKSNVPRKDQIAAIRPILKGIQESIQREGSHASFYPEHMTEQVITAFFCEKFNDQNDIWKLIAELDDDIVDHSIPLPTKEDFLTTEDFPIIAQKKEAYTFEDVYALANAEAFTSLTPYKSGAPLLSNGSTSFYDRSKNEILQGPTFSDCAEMSMRHVLNLLLFDPETREFDLTAIKAYVAEHSPDNPYFKNFVTFIEHQKPDQANNGDIVMRSLFNTVVGDLNTLDDPLKVSYVKDTNEVKSGFINIIKIFQKVFGLEVKELPVGDFAVRKYWLEESLKTLFTALSPTKAYTMNLYKLEEEKNGEISGDLAIRVKSTKTDEDLFSFIFYSNFGKNHSNITDLQTLKKMGVQYYTEALKTHPTSIHKNTVEESLWLLSPEVKDRALQQPFYALFNTFLADNVSKINFLRTFNENYESWKAQMTGEHLLALKRILQNILDGISWDDPFVLRRASPVVVDLSQKEELRETLHNVKKLDLSKSFLKKMSFEVFAGLEELSMADAKSLEEISLNGLTHLTMLDLSNSAVKKIEELDILSNLEGLDLSGTGNLEEISLKGLNSLTYLNFNDSVVRQIDGLEKLSNLEDLDISGTVNLEQQISLKDFNHLKRLNFSKSSIKNIILDNLSPLENLDISGTRNLEEVSFNRLAHLKKLSLNGSAVKRLEGLDTLTSLEELNLSQMFQLEEFSLKDLKFLKDLFLWDSGVKRIALDNLPSLENFEPNDVFEEVYLKGVTALKNLFLSRSTLKKVALDTLSSLETLNLSYTESLEEVSLKGLSSLKKLNLSVSNVKRLEGLEMLSSLEELDLSRTKNLEELYLNNLSNLKKISMENTGFKKVSLETLSSLEELNLWLTQNLEELSLKDLTKLKKLSLEGSGVKNVVLDNLSSLEELNLWKTQNLEELSLRNLSNLRGLSLMNSNIRTASLNNLSSLEWLDLDRTKNLEEVSLINLPQLKKLYLWDTGLKKMTLNALPSLEELELTHAKNLEEVSLKDLTNLKKLTMAGVEFKEMAHLNSFSSLEVLYLKQMKNVEEVSLKNLTHLNALILEDTSSKKIALESLPNFRALVLAQMPNLEEIDLKDLVSLKSLSLSFSSARKVTLDTLSNLEELQLSFTNNLDKLSFKGHCDQLKTINLSYSNVRRLSGLNFLNTVEVLDLSSAKNMTELEFTEDHKQLKIKLKGSGIMRGNIRGIEHLDEANIVW
jgi:hypothetical protein